MRKLHPARIVPIAALALLVCAPPSGAADRITAPPGNAGVQEYVEVVPDGSGARRTIDLRGASVADHGRGGLGSGMGRLARQGEDGAAAAALAQAGAPKAKRSRKNGPGADAGESAASAAGQRLAGGAGPGGMGAALPLVLASMLIGAAALAYRQRRHSNSP